MRALTLNLIVVAFAFGVANTGYAADKKETKSEKSWTTMTTEQRTTMATAHEAMAACLRTTKPMEECREEMFKSCKDSMGKSECPMMKGMYGMDHHDMMKKNKSNE